jgi:PAS domain S-box-containing protein
MNEDVNGSLRGRALAMLQGSLEDVARIPAEEVPKLLYELQVHQMELEIQNEELRQAQIQLAQSRDSYSDLYEFAPVGYLTLDKQGLIRQANLTSAMMLDVERKQLVGRKFSDFVSNESQDAWHLHRRAVFAESKTVACELRMVVRDGVSPSYRLQSLAVRDDKWNLGLCRTALSDVTDRRIAFDALSQLNINLDESLSDTSFQLERSFQHLRLLYEAVAHLAEGVMITGDHTEWPAPEIIFVNEAMCKISGYAADELIGKTPRILNGEATSNAALEQIPRDLKASGKCAIEVVNYRKDGTPYDVEIVITPMFDASGKRSNFVSIQRDITQRKRIAEELRREHEFNTCIVKTGQVATLVLDLEGRIVQFNPYLEKITGWRFEEVQGRDFMQTFLPHMDREAIRLLSEGTRTGIMTAGNLNPILTQGGEHRYIEWHDSPLTDASGRLIGLLCMGQDVTQRRELERHILEIANEERQRIGTDLHDGVGQELTGLSMVADSLAVALARESRPEVKLAEKLRTGLQQSLSQVRTLSRGMNPVDIDAQGLMSALEELVAQLNELTGIRCSFHCDAPVLLRDNETAVQLYRIAQEATANAMRHAQPDRITISLARVGQQVVLRIIDNGSGIATTDTRSAGMGLRTMAYRARMIRGELDVHPFPDGGTEVVCSISVNS